MFGVLPGLVVRTGLVLCMYASGSELRIAYVSCLLFLVSGLALVPVLVSGLVPGPGPLPFLLLVLVLVLVLLLVWSLVWFCPVRSDPCPRHLDPAV